MQQAAEIRAANATLKEARAAYYPSLSLNVSPAVPSLYAIQRPFDWSHTADLTGRVSFNLKWTVFDGGARKSRAAQAQADIHAAEAQTNLKKNQIADEVWTAYSNLNTAFRQHRTAIALLEAASQSYHSRIHGYWPRVPSSTFARRRWFGVDLPPLSCLRRSANASASGDTGSGAHA